MPGAKEEKSQISSPGSDVLYRLAAEYVMKQYLDIAVGTGWRRVQALAGLFLWARACPLNHKNHIRKYPYRNGKRLNAAFTKRLKQQLKTNIHTPQVPEWHDFKHKFTDKEIFDIYLRNFDYYKLERPYATVESYRDFVDKKKNAVKELLQPNQKIVLHEETRSFREFSNGLAFPNKLDDDDLRSIIQLMINMKL